MAPGVLRSPEAPRTVDASPSLGSPRQPMPPVDLPSRAFLQLREEFFDASGQPKAFTLRDKRNTQDDPLDELLGTVVLRKIPGVECVKSPGPLITPDLVIYDPARSDRLGVDKPPDLESFVAIEVKKLERTANGSVARASGLDYNTTPPCGTVQVYDRRGTPVLLRGFYLFICLENAGTGTVQVTSLVLTDGDLLNSDVQLYQSIVGQRTKGIGLGTFGDGVNRNRPMMIFGNPLGLEGLDRSATLIHPSASLVSVRPELSSIGTISRTHSGSSTISTFHCYRDKRDVPAGAAALALHDPFRVPDRSAATQSRGMFRLPFDLKR